MLILAVLCWLAQLATAQGDPDEKMTLPECGSDTYVSFNHGILLATCQETVVDLSSTLLLLHTLSTPPRVRETDRRLFISPTLTSGGLRECAECRECGPNCEKSAKDCNTVEAEQH